MKSILKLISIIASTLTLILGLVSIVNDKITFPMVRNCIWVSVAFWMIFILYKCITESCDLLDGIGGVLANIAAFVSGFLVITGLCKVFNLFAYFNALSGKICLIVGAIVGVFAIIVNVVRNQIYAFDED